MSKLKDLVSKGVRLIVADTEEGSAPGATAEERDLPPESFEEGPPKRVTHSEVTADVEDFGAVYQEAGIELPLHGYGIDKVAEMLENKRLETLQREVKATAVLAALEAASVPIHDVIQDAVLRDKALDAFEAAKAHEVQELQAKSGARIEAIKNEIDVVPEGEERGDGRAEAGQGRGRPCLPGPAGAQAARGAAPLRRRRALPRGRRQPDHDLECPGIAPAPACEAVARPGMTPHVFRR